MPIIIPERTVDAWLAAYLGERYAKVRLWAPTPPAQKKKTPWDIEVASPAKIVLFEDKAVWAERGVRIQLRMQQHDRLLVLSSAGCPIFYCVPCPDFRAVTRDSAGMMPDA